MRRNRKKAAAPNRFESDVFHDCGAVITASVSELTLRPGKSTTIALTCSGNLPKSYLFWAQLQPDITLKFGQRLDNGRRILATITGTKPSEGYARIYLGSDAKTFEEAVLYAYADVYVVVRGAHTLPNRHGNDASQQKDSEPIYRPQFETSPSAQSQRTKGDDKLVHVTLTAEQAANGCRIDVRGGRHGTKLRVTIPQHTVNGQVLRLNGEGHGSRDGGEPGDLLIQIHAPKPKKSSSSEQI